MNKIFSFILSLALVIGPVTVHAEQQDTRAMDAYTKDAGTGGDKGKKFYMLQAGMIGTAAGGAVMVSCIPTSYHWSHYIFAAGAAAFIVGEIALAKEKTDYHKRKKESLEIDESKLSLPTGVGAADVAQKDTQTKAIQAALDEETNNKKMMEKRKKWADIVSLVYDIAVIGAGVEAGLSLFPVYTGFVPDTLQCYPIAPLALVVGNGLAWIYAANAADDQSGGKLGLNSHAFMALLKLEINILVGLAIPAVITSWGRIAYFGAAALIAREIVKGLEERIGIAQANIDKLTTALAAWNNATNGNSAGVALGATAGSAGGAAAGAGGGNGGGNPPHPTSNYLQTAASGTYPKPSGGCIGKNGVHSSAACKNRLSFNPKMPKFQIGEISKFNQHALDFANATTADNMQAAGISGDALMANAARIKAVKDQVLAEAQAKLDAQGGKKQSILASIDAQHKNMMKSLGDGAAKSGFGSGMDVAGTEATLDKTDAEGTGETKTAVTTTTVGGPAAAAPVIPELFSGTEGDVGANPTGLTEAEKDLMATDYAQNKNEYLSNNNDSLFQVLSKTYVRNLDKILVRKKKVIEEAPAAAPAE